MAEPADAALANHDPMQLLTLEILPRRRLYPRLLHVVVDGASQPNA